MIFSIGNLKKTWLFKFYKVIYIYFFIYQVMVASKKKYIHTKINNKQIYTKAEINNMQ